MFGWTASGNVKDDEILKVVDRHDAISAALKLALANDMVVLAGKGHENYQVASNVVSMIAKKLKTN